MIVAIVVCAVQDEIRVVNQVEDVGPVNVVHHREEEFVLDVWERL